jgi:hypothetical protein
VKVNRQLRPKHYVIIYHTLHTLLTLRKQNHEISKPLDTALMCLLLKTFILKVLRHMLLQGDQNFCVHITITVPKTRKNIVF